MLVSQPESPLRPGQSPKVLSGDTEPPLSWGLGQSKSTCHLRDYISETHFEKDKLDPRGRISVLVLGRLRKEKGRSHRRGSGRRRPGCGKQLVEDGK